MDDQQISFQAPEDVPDCGLAFNILEPWVSATDDATAGGLTLVAVEVRSAISLLEMVAAAVITPPLGHVGTVLLPDYSIKAVGHPSLHQNSKHRDNADIHS